MDRVEVFGFPAACLISAGVGSGVFVKEFVKINHDAVSNAFTDSSTFPNFNPAVEGEIYGFGAVEAEIEAGVVAIWESNDELAGLLSDFMNRYGVRLKDCWGENACFVAEEFRACFGLRDEVGCGGGDC